MKNSIAWIYIVFIIAALFFVVTRVDKFIKIKALDDCAHTSRYEAKNSDGSSVSYPLEDVYKKCVSEKGYEK